jgi:hypothetical protein
MRPFATQCQEQNDQSQAPIGICRLPVVSGGGVNFKAMGDRADRN